MNRSQKNCLFSNHRIWIAAAAYPWNPRAMGRGFLHMAAPYLKFLTYSQEFLSYGTIDMWTKSSAYAEGFSLFVSTVPPVGRVVPIVK